METVPYMEKGIIIPVHNVVLLPGVSIGALLSLVCYGSSIYLAFRDHGTVTGILVIVIILAALLLRYECWPSSGGDRTGPEGSPASV